MMSEGSEAYVSSVCPTALSKKYFSCHPGSPGLADFKILLNLQALIYPSSDSKVINADRG